MGTLSAKGTALAALLWVGFLFFLLDDSACLRAVCGKGDMLLFAVVGVGMTFPAYFAVAILGILAPSLMDGSKKTPG